MTVSADSISFTRFSDDYCLLPIFALDTNGFPIIKFWELHFGTVNKPVLIFNPDNSPVKGVYAEANATVYPGLTSNCTTATNNATHGPPVGDDFHQHLPLPASSAPATKRTPRRRS